MEKNLKEISELKIKCQHCGTRVVTQIGNVIFSCPQCEVKFIDKGLGYNPFEILAQAFKEANKNKNAEFYFVCDEVEMKGVK